MHNYHAIMRLLCITRDGGTVHCFVCVIIIVLLCLNYYIAHVTVMKHIVDKKIKIAQQKEHLRSPALRIRRRRRRRRRMMRN